jgi:hypothetical protein
MDSSTRRDKTYHEDVILAPTHRPFGLSSEAALAISQSFVSMLDQSVYNALFKHLG